MLGGAPEDTAAIVWTIGRRDEGCESLVLPRPPRSQTAAYPTQWPEWFEIIGADTFATHCAFYVDTPDQLAKLPPRLQESHAELLARCAPDQETYPQFIHTQQRPAVHAITPAVHAITPAGQDSTNKYK